MTGTDSVVVTKTVRAVAPFVFTFGLFTVLHGTKTVGGGFQGGVVVAAGVVTMAFGFGAGQVTRALGTAAPVAAAAAGLALLAVVSVGPLALGGALLDVGAYDALPVADATVYAVELAELGIGATVAGVVVLLFLELAGGGR